MAAQQAPCSGAPVVLVLMGVAGCGKSTVAGLLSDRLGWPFAEGDALHPEANVAKLSAGQPLTDADRAPWLARIAAWVSERLERGSGIITCSALKRAYRQVIDPSGCRVVFVHLAGDPRTIGARLAVRQGHFMPPQLLAGQLADLEEPGPDELAIRVEVGPAPAEIARQIVERLALPLLPGAG